MTGDLQGLKDSLTFGPADQISTKILIFDNISKVPGPLEKISQNMN